MKPTYTDAGADISKCGRYRYRLWREWRGTHDPKNWHWVSSGRSLVLDRSGNPLGHPKSCVFVMLNPSTADGSHDDATIKRCVEFARRWKYERLEVVNLFAYRATIPEELFRLNLDEAVGVDNMTAVENATMTLDTGLVVCAWGNHGSYLGQNQTVVGWMGSAKLYSLGVTASGQPKHPLYLPNDTRLRRFNTKVVV